jgi:hypothetical protein
LPVIRRAPPFGPRERADPTRATRGQRRAIKRDARRCPDDRRGVAFGEVMWSPKPWWTEQFYWMLRAEGPACVLELGTSLGMTGLYVLAALARNGAGRFVTIELGPNKVAYARGLFAAFGDAQATCLQGRSDRVLPELLAREPLFD